MTDKQVWLITGAGRRMGVDIARAPGAAGRRRGDGGAVRPARRTRRHGKQLGDPAELAAAVVQLAALDEPPTRFSAGADAVATLEAKAEALQSQADACREPSSSLGHSVG